MNDNFDNMLLSEIKHLRDDIVEVKEDLAYLKGKLGHGFTQKDDKKELVKTGSVAGLISAVMLVIYEFITKLKS